MTTKARKETKGKAAGAVRRGGRVAEPTLGEQIIEGLEQAIAYERGELRDLTVTRHPITARRAAAAPAGAFDASRVRSVRAALGFSQRVFAEALNVSPVTVKAWEQGRRVPDGAALRLLEIAETHPDIIRADVRPRERGRVGDERQAQRGTEQG